MRRLQGLKWLAVAAVAVIGPAGANELGSAGSDCPERGTPAIEASFVNWPGEGSFFDLAPRSPILMP